MIYASIALFALAAVLGLTILVKWLTKKEASRTVIYSHGILAAIALVLVVVYALQNTDNYPRVACIRAAWILHVLPRPGKEIQPDERSLYPCHPGRGRFRSSVCFRIY
jgi:hypothetical protein